MPLRNASLILALVLLAPPTDAAPTADWPVTEGAPGGGRYSPLTDIDRGNVGTLQVVWTYRHGDVKSGGWLPDSPIRSSPLSRMRCSRIGVGNRLTPPTVRDD